MPPLQPHSNPLPQFTEEIREIKKTCSHQSCPEESKVSLLYSVIGEWAACLIQMQQWIRAQHLESLVNCTHCSRKSERPIAWVPQSCHQPIRQLGGLCFSFFLLPVLVYWGCHNEVQQARWLKTAEIHWLTVLEAGSPRSRGQKGHVPFETYRGILPCLLVCWWSMAFPDM